MGVQKRNPLVSLDRRCRVEADGLVKEHPQLYNKKQKDWLNVAAKNSCCDRVGEQLEPPVTGFQIRKHYEIMRTRVGKIMRNEGEWGWPATEECS